MTSEKLFEVAIPPSSSAGNQVGTIVCTSPASQVYILTFSSPPDNRLVTSFCQSLLLALDIVEFSYPPGVVITTSSIGKFYSNGLNIDHAFSREGFFPNILYRLFKRLLTYPMPTIALVNGHAFAGGLMLAMYHDYRIFNPSRGFLCLNELDFGYPLKPAMSSIFREKIPHPAVYRAMVLEAKRFAGKEALECGIVDGLGGIEEVMALVKERNLTEKGKSGVYGTLKGEMYRESLGFLEGHTQEEKRYAGMIKDDVQRKLDGQAVVKEWERNSRSVRGKL